MSAPDKNTLYRYDKPNSRYAGQRCTIIQEIQRNARPSMARVQFEDGRSFCVEHAYLTRIAPTQPTNIPEEPTMSGTFNVDSNDVISFKTVTYVAGTPIDKLTEAAVSALLTNTQAEINRIKALPRRTKKMEARIIELDDSMSKLIALIDERDGTPTLEDRVGALEAAVAPTDK